MSILKDELPFPEDSRLTKIVSQDSDSVSDSEILNQLPERIGRYELVRSLAKGGQCVVLLGHDPNFARDVAIKVPRPDRQIDNALWQEFLHEARSVSRMRHEAVIPVLDVDRTESGLPFVVMEFIDGMDLHSYWMNREFELGQVLQIIREIASGLQFVHEHGIVHRDLKPGNILIDDLGRARIADFGLAIELNESRNWRANTLIAGTAKFMSPEQLSGESHRIDERTDIWGLGVILFWMCAGEYPFPGQNFLEQQEQIRAQSHPHLFDCNPGVPVELDRICRKCLSERRHDRYKSATAFLEDIEALRKRLEGHDEISNEWIYPYSSKTPHRGKAPESAMSGVIPRGLKPYDESDVAYFHELLPGPRDRFGIPESLRFWLTRLADPIGDCSHGLIYGASGCGKTSFVKAGLIPRLPTDIGVVYFECHGPGDQIRLTSAICQKLGLSEEGTALPELLRRIRERQIPMRFQRLLIVLDQFEQFLTGTANHGDSPLVAALRQCDGKHLSCLILVQDDFWVPTQEFLKHLEVHIQDGRNSMALPLLDQRHAEKILIQFGKSYGSIPRDCETDLEAPIQQFASTAVTMISCHGKVNGAHLAMLASVIGNLPWSKIELDRMGGRHGILIQFMNENFSLQTAPASNRRYLPEVTGILESLLPRARSSSLSQKTVSELVAACPVGTTVEGFESSIRLLERDCYLIKSVVSPKDDHEKAYQLSHEILHDPLRKWLAFEKNYSWRGRQLRDLEEWSEAWESRRSQRYLPSLIKLLQFQWAVRGRSVDNTHSQFLKVARRHHAKRGLLAVLMLVMTGLLAILVAQQNKSADQMQQTISRYLNGGPSDALQQLANLESVTFRPDLLDEQPRATDRARLRYAAAVVDLFDSSSPHIRDVLEAYRRADVSEKAVVLGVLREISLPVVSRQLLASFDSSRTLDEQLRYCWLAFELGDESLLEKMLSRSVGDPTAIYHLRHRFREFSTMGGAELAGAIVAPRESGPITTMLMSILFAQNLDEEVNSTTLDVVLALAESLHAESSDPFEHSLTQWVLRRHGRELPPAKAEMMDRWHRYAPDVALVEIPSGEVHLSTGRSTPRTQGVAPFRISNTEITLGQFRKFLDDEAYQGEKPLEVLIEDGEFVLQQPHQWRYDPATCPSGDHPVTCVSAFVAAMYCNWLSHKNELEKAYEIGERSVKWNETANGFRLPNFGETRYVVQGGRPSGHFMGADAQLDWLQSYGSFVHFLPLERRREFERLNFPTCLKMPDQLGLFDAVGGLAEICLDHDADMGLLTRHTGPASYQHPGTVLDENIRVRQSSPFSANFKLGFRVVLDGH